MNHVFACGAGSLAYRGFDLPCANKRLHPPAAWRLQVRRVVIPLEGRLGWGEIWRRP